MINLKTTKRLLPMAIATALAGNAMADDELMLYVFDGQTPVEGAEIKVDDQVVGSTRVDGSLMADLSAGSHVIKVVGPEGRESRARFSAGSGQLVDVVSNLDGSAPKVDVFSATESAADRKDAPVGTLRISAFAGQDPAKGKLVIISNGGGGVSTNQQGQATKELPRGLYTLKVGDVSTTVRVVGGVTRGARLLLPAENEGMSIEMPALEEVFVIASFDPGGFEVSERDTANIVDTIGVEMLARFSDSDVAASVVRVPGISVQDDKYVFIRGLGGRYISSTLNNATMPSTNPSKRTVPLDLFPSNFVSQLDVKKTFLPYMPGESTGGNLVINTKTFPDEAGGAISISTTYTNDLTGETVAVDGISGDYDWMGWDDGAREQSDAVKEIANILNSDTYVATDGQSYPLDSYTRGELQHLGALLIKDGFDIDTQSAKPDGKFGVNYGNLFYLDDAEIGFYAAANYNNSWSMRDNGYRNSYTPTMDLLNNFRYQQYQNEIEASGLFSLGVNIGDSTYEWNNVVSRVTSSQVERVVGEEGDEQQSLYRHTIQWEEREYVSTQLLGSHFLNEDGSLFGEWQLTASRADRYAPDRREVEFRASQTRTDAETLKDGFNFGQTNDKQEIALVGFFLEPGVILRRYDELTDTNFDGSFDLTWDVFDDGASFAKVQTGVQMIYRERESESYTYGFNINQSRDDLLAAPNMLVSDVIYACEEGQPCGDGGIARYPTDGFVFDDKTLASDSYDAELEYNSAYAMYDHTFDSLWQVIVGARYETYKQTTNTFSLQGEGGSVQSQIDESSVLPSLGINWFYREDQQLRFAVSKTVARPDFKEAANATFYDNEFNIRVRGNPYLQISEIINADLRWEWYFSEMDSVSVAAFYKDMDKPIERVVQPASGTAGNSRTFQNSDTGELYGLEVEGHKEFALTDDYNQTVFVTFNASWIESEVTAKNQDARALQGQPEYTANLVIGYDNIGAGQQLTLLMNQNGKSIADVGVSGAPDVYLEPRGEINLVYRWDINDDLTLKAKAENITNEKVEYTQGGQTFQSYEKGTSFQVGIDWRF